MFIPQKQRRDLDARMEYLKNGPFNVVFHNMQPDWIEEEMADDIGQFKLFKYYNQSRMSKYSKCGCRLQARRIGAASEEFTQD